jgi:hypothetical protein
MKSSLSSTFLALALTVTSFNGYAAKDKIQTEVIKAYVDVQEALVSSDFEVVKKASKELQSKLTKESPKLRSEVKELTESKTLKESRNEFKDVSSIVIKNYKEEIEDNFIIAYCPMAGAKWIQRKGEISNPYMNKEMQGCGEKI